MKSIDMKESRQRVVDPIKGLVCAWATKDVKIAPETLTRGFPDANSLEKGLSRHFLACH